MNLSIDGLHPKQKEIWQSDARFKVLSAGRRWGKSRMAIAMGFAEGWEGGAAWFISPSYPMAQIAWREIVNRAQRLPHTSINLAERIVTFPGGGFLQIKSADNPDSLRGIGLDLAVLDEAAYMTGQVWHEVVRPALMDKQGRAILCSTPNGHNYFWQLFENARVEPGWQAWQLPTGSNPYVDQSEIDTAKNTMTERVYLQEIEAEFVDDTGTLFRNLRACATATGQHHAIEEHHYVIGADWGKANDFTVFSVIDATTQEQVLMDRSRMINYTVQSDRLASLYEAFKPDVIVAESNSIGEPIIEALQERGLPVQPFVTTNASKAKVIEGLVLAFEREMVRILPDDYQLSELTAFGIERLPSGIFRYSAPEGMHDDTVIALALAYDGASKYCDDFSARVT